MSACLQIEGIWPARLDLPLQKGDDFLIVLTLSQGGVAIDLAGKTFKAQARKRKGDAAAAFEFTCTALLPTTEGKLALSLAAAVSGAITCGERPDQPASWYVWDLEQLDGGKRTLLEGIVRVNGDVTRD